LRDLELQCKERVDLLETLQKTRKAESKNKSNVVQRVVSGGSTGGDSFIGGGTVPAFDYATLSKPQLQNSTQQTLASRPQPVQAASTQSIRDRVTPQMLEEAQREADKRAAASIPPNMPPPAVRSSRSPSPDKKSGFFKSTLRAGKESKFAASMRAAKVGPAVPAKTAATHVWPAGQQSDSSGYRSDVSRQQSVDLSRSDQQGANIGRKQNYNRQYDIGNEDVRRAVSMDLPARPRSHEPTLRDGPRGTLVDALVRRSQDLGSRSDMGPPPRPQPRVNTNTSTGYSSGPSSATTSPPLPQLNYRSEYGEQGLDQRNMQMLKSRKARMDLDASKAATAAQPQPPQSPSKLRQAFRMVPRKAVGSGPSPQPPSQQVYNPPTSRPAQKEQMPPPAQTSRSAPRSNVETQRSAPRSNVEAQQAKKVVRPKASMQPAAAAPRKILAEAETDSEDYEPMSSDKEWDARVKYIMKHLPKGVDEAAAKSILNEIVVKGDEVHWEDIAGLDIAKNALKEAVVYPFLRPDLFMGLREPARGMLLFGPPGTGKTMLARSVATESKSTFFAISASSLTSKYLGESEKLVRALFSLAKMLTPAIIFVDEIDSLLSSRTGGSGEHEATRRIKTEFLIQWSDLASAAAGKQSTEGDASRVLVLAATNLPWAIDDAARRRFVRRQYIPLPEGSTREYQLRKLMGHQKHALRDRDFKRLVVLTDGMCSAFFH
jgi:hypothetical protein